MKCSTCGAEIKDGARFCPACGAVQVSTPVQPAEPQAAPQPAPKKKFPLVPVAIAAAAVVVLVVIISVIAGSSGGSSGGYAKQKNYLGIGNLEEDKLVVITSAGKAVSKAIDGEVSGGAVSADGSAAVVRVDDEESIYYTDGSKIVKITDKDPVSSWISNDGKTVFYMIEGEEEYDLYIYRNGKSEKVATDVKRGSAVYAPDGSAAAFVTIKDDEETGNYWNGKAVVKIGKERTPLAISNGAKYVYFIRESTVYVQQGDKEDSRQKVAGGYSRGYLNADGSEILVYDGEDMRLCVKGAEPKKLGSGSWYLVAPAGLQSTGTGRLTSYGISSFADKYFRNSSDDNKVVYVSKKLETRSVFKNGSGITLLDDNKTFFYIRNDNLYTIDGSKEDAEAVKLASDVDGFVVTADGKTVFYMNEDDELVAQKGTGKPVTICDDVDDYGLFQGKTLFYLSDGVLYRSTGAKGEKVAVTGEVEAFRTDRFFLRVLTDEDKAYISVDGKKFFYTYESD